MRPVRHLLNHIKRWKDAEAAPKSPCCHICKSPNCYELSVQGEYIVKNYLQDNDGFLCSDCYDFMVNTGKWFTYVQHLILKVVVLFRRRNAKTSSLM